MTTSPRIIVIGAGMGGLAAAIDLARRGAEVRVLERATAPGGRMREVMVGGAPIDAGPTVFTMRWVFEALFEDAGTTLEDHLDLQPAEILARHAWREGGRLDLFADVERSADAIGEFAGTNEANGYRAFCARSADIYRTLEPTFIRAERPSPIALARRVGFSHLDALWRTAPGKTLWTALGEHFKDPRLRQLFGRYATYCGCSPMRAPATLMLVAHVEQEGVWLVQGGMRRVADAMQALAEGQGARFRFGAEVEEILVERGRAGGVRLRDGERLPADAVVFNGDGAALGAGRLGRDALRGAPRVPEKARSLSAITWCLKARARGFPLLHHNVFFAEDYAAEFQAIFGERRVTAAPTVYVCAQDCAAGEGAPVGPEERLLVLINAPPSGDRQRLDADAIAELEMRAFGLLGACGLTIEQTDGPAVVTTPSGFDALFPGSGGALYGQANHGAMATFKRAGARSRLPGLYLAGGTVHPGPGIPMAAMSGRLAAARLLEDFSKGGLSGGRRR
jgi:1-hydroxycarotenoid 3,4-desaturase